MSSLTDLDKRNLEELLNMDCGFALELPDAMHGGYFSLHSVEIHGRK